VRARGINGALLGMAIAANEPLAGLQETWFDEGDIGRLIRACRHRPALASTGNEILLEAGAPEDRRGVAR